MPLPRIQANIRTTFEPQLEARGYVISSWWWNSKRSCSLSIRKDLGHFTIWNFVAKEGIPTGPLTQDDLYDQMCESLKSLP